MGPALAAGRHDETDGGNEMSKRRYACPTCGGPCTVGADRCRRCYKSDRVAEAEQAMPHCADCGVRLRGASYRRCGPCYAAYRVAVSEQHRRCVECGGVKAEARYPRCVDCHRRRGRAGRTCPVCRGPKSSPRSDVCRACRRAADIERGRWGDRVDAFDPRAFRRLRQRADLELTPRLIEEACGVSAKLISAWEVGTIKPTRRNLDLVLGVLGLEKCGACRGLGHVEPGGEAVAELRGAVTRVAALSKPVALPRPMRELVLGGVAFRPDIGRVRAADGEASLTRREGEVLAILMANPGPAHTSAALGHAIYGSSGSADNAHAVRVVMSRLRHKLQAIGAGGLVRPGDANGYGWRIEPDDSAEASA